MVFNDGISPPGGGSLSAEKLLEAASYDVLKEVGRGAFARCLLLRRRDDGRLVIAKVPTAGPVGAGAAASVAKQQKRREDMERENEIKLLSELNHPNVVQYLGAVGGGASFDASIILMEYASGGALDAVVAAARDGGEEGKRYPKSACGSGWCRLWTA